MKTVVYSDQAISTGVDFDANFIIDLGDGITLLIKNEIARHLPELQQWHTQIQELAACLEEDTRTVASAMKECIETRLRKFNACLIQLSKFIQNNTGTFLQLFDAKLTYGMIWRYALDNWSRLDYLNEQPLHDQT